MQFLARFIWVVVLIGGLAQIVLAQPVLRIDTLPARGQSLGTGWRWHPGDNPAWASPTFDDSQWDTIRPTQPISKLPQIRAAEIGWLRLKVSVDSALTNRPLALIVRQAVASEIYLDGQLLRRFGRVSRRADEEQTYRPKTAENCYFVFNRAGKHQLAVRISYTQRNVLFRTPVVTPNPVLSVQIRDPNRFTEQQAASLRTFVLFHYLLAGIFLMLGVLHLLYYSYYRQQRVQLTFAVTMLLCAAHHWLYDLGGDAVNPVASQIYFYAGTQTISLYIMLLLATLYEYLQHRLSTIFWVLGVVFMGSSLLIGFLPEQSQDPLDWIYSAASVLLYMDGVRISLIALRQKRSNALLILYAVGLLAFFMLIRVAGTYWIKGFNPDAAWWWDTITTALFYVSTPLTISVLLARDNARTNRNLQRQLGEIEQLSREKESLLTRQNETLERQVTERTAELNASLRTLRSAQAQLIQKEKLASLGEITAGIAHEIQNPLNFVNNFSEVSTELVSELEDEQQKPVRDAQLEAELLSDLKQNLQKITHHGGRAGSIVRGMLEHSRASTGQREPADLNALAIEYLRLAYQGLRAKNQAFTCELVTDSDLNVGLVDVVSQDIGRVLLNLFNNAFYAVGQRATTPEATGTGYVPTVWVRTRRLAHTIEIQVRDNGTGMADAVKAKIFQPFFTTKPTGEGTGLGLSLSYDIITKGHGGSLTVDSHEGAGATFVVTLPV